MLLSLNDDCLRLICECLSLEDQITLTHVCQRLQLIVEDIWKFGIFGYKNRKVTITRQQAFFFDDHENDFYNLMRCISDNVEELELERIQPTNFQGLNFLNFPKLTGLNVNIHYGDNMNADQHTKLIGKLFPNLRKLTICAEITGQYLWKLEGLDELHMYSCEDLKTSYFKKIFSTLRLRKLSLIYWGYNTCLDESISAIADCKTLEEICIDDHHLIMIIGDLFKLKGLRKIVTYTRDYDAYLLDEITKHRGNVMETIIFVDVFWSKDEICENVVKMMNLKRLVFSEDDISNEQLMEIGQALAGTLEEFHFVNCRSEMQNEQGFLDLLTYCLGLKIFNISKTKVDISFIRRIAQLIASQHGKRKTPLLLCCHGTQVTKSGLEVTLVSFQSIILPEMLHISFEPLPMELPSCRFFQCEWRTEYSE